MLKLFLFLFLFFDSLSGLCINPEREYQYFPKDFDITDYCEIYVETPDKYQIVVWEFTPKVIIKDKVIILSNGDSGNMSYSLYYVKKLLDFGYTVITYDYRGFGASDNFTSDNNYLFYNEYAYDLEAVLRYTKEKYSNSKKIGFMSFSMGTIISTIVIEKEQVDFVIAEGFVLNPHLSIERLKKLNNQTYRLPNKLINFNEAIKKMICPMLLFTGKKDMITTIEDSQKIIKLSPANRKLVIHKGGHGEGLLNLTNKITGDIYFERIENFLSEKGNQ